MAGSGVPLVYLIHGTDEVRIRQERTRLVAQLLPTEHRAENLTEIEPPSNRQLSLSQIAADLMAELATPSFFPEVRRVIVVEQLADLVGAPPSPGGGEGETPSASRRKRQKPPTSGGTDVTTAFCRFLERDLPQTGNILIICAVEEPEKRRKIRLKSPIYLTIQAVGRIIQYNESPVIFRFLDAFNSRDLNASLRILPEILNAEEGGGSVFRLLTRQVRFLIQAKLLERSGESKSSNEEFAAKYFPPAKGLNLMQEHSFTIEKTRRAAKYWSLGELNVLLPRLERLTKVVYPSSADAYVPDIEVELERFIMEACSRIGHATAAR